MQKKWKRTLLCLTAATLAASLAAGCAQTGQPGDKYEDYNAEKQPGDDSFDFDGNYVSPELTIDGIGTEEAWTKASVLASFGVGGNAATVKAYRGESALFFLFALLRFLADGVFGVIDRVVRLVLGGVDRRLDRLVLGFPEQIGNSLFDRIEQTHCFPPFQMISI